MFLRWLVAGILGLGVIFTVSSEDVAKPEPEAATLTQEEMETILDTKFSEGKYSRRGPDGCLRCHDDTSDKPATGIFDNIHGKSANLHGPMNDKQCEACHGPANNHERNPRKGQVREPMITFGPNSLFQPKSKTACVYLVTKMRNARLGTVASTLLKGFLVQAVTNCIKKTIR